MQLKVCEIFRSIQGETTLAGFPSLFIRLSGCNLNCAWCDTPYAREEGEMRSIEDLMKEVQSAGWFHHITVTGGEPLIQEAAPVLIQRLLSSGFSVQVETNGSIDIAGIPLPARRIVDVKTPSSGEQDSFLIDNLTHLTAHDELKIPIADERDFVFAKNFIENHKGIITHGLVINFSPVHGRMDAAKLSEMILDENIEARVNLQLHTLIWPKGERKNL